MRLQIGWIIEPWRAVRSQRAQPRLFKMSRWYALQWSQVYENDVNEKSGLLRGMYYWMSGEFFISKATSKYHKFSTTESGLTTTSDTVYSVTTSQSSSPANAHTLLDICGDLPSIDWYRLSLRFFQKSAGQTWSNLEMQLQLFLGKIV